MTERKRLVLDANILIDALLGHPPAHGELRRIIDGGAGTDTLAFFGARDKFVVTTVAGITRVEGVEGTEEYAGHITTSKAARLQYLNRWKNGDDFSKDWNTVEIGRAHV